MYTVYMHSILIIINGVMYNRISSSFDDFDPMKITQTKIVTVIKKFKVLMFMMHCLLKPKIMKLDYNLNLKSKFDIKQSISRKVRLSMKKYFYNK